MSDFGRGFALAFYIIVTVVLFIGVLLGALGWWLIT